MEDLIESIKKNEGFVGTVYKDTLGFDTIGYGTKLPLSEEEAEVLLLLRLKDKIEELIAREPFFMELPADKQEVIAEMCYQMGVSGVLNFKRMWKALKEFEFFEASVEMMDSKWAKQTFTRAYELSLRMREE